MYDIIVSIAKHEGVDVDEKLGTFVCSMSPNYFNKQIRIYHLDQFQSSKRFNMSHFSIRSFRVLFVQVQH